MFRNLRRRLLMSYLAVMVAVLAASVTVMYQFMRYSLYKKSDSQSLILADAAAHSLPAIEADARMANRKLVRTIDHDGDLDIPWQDLREDQQGIEWFDSQGQRLAEAGRYIPKTTFSSRYLVQHDHLRSLTIPVYSNHHILKGYVRVSALTEEVEEDLEHLLWGVGWGGLLAVGLSGLGGWWLTQQAFQPVELSVQKLKQFTADASHELRSPLTAIRTSIDVIQSHPERIHPADVEKIKSIASATYQMSDLVNDLLIIARSDADVSVHEWVTIPIDELIEDVMDSLAPEFEKKEVILHYDHLNNHLNPVWVNGNASQLRRLLTNLIENALYYSSKQGTVSVQMSKIDRWAVIQVNDTGIGIAPEHLPLVFDRFWRADPARDRREGGSGLGLAIAQAIAHQHGGMITATSQLGQGSCFTVQLPAVSERQSGSVRE